MNHQQQRTLAASALYLVFLLVLHHGTRTPTASRQFQPPRGRMLLSAGADAAIDRGPGLAAVPDSALRGTAAAAGSSDGASFMSASTEASVTESYANCPLAGRLIDSIPAGRRAPISWAADGSAVVVGSRTGNSSVASVYLLDSIGSCNFSAPLALPVPDLPKNYAFDGDGPPPLSAAAMSASADMVLLASLQPAVFVPPPPPPPGRSSSPEGPLPFHLVAFVYSRSSQGMGYSPAAILPIPASPTFASGKIRVAVSGVSLSTDGTTALVCLMAQGCSPNPSACPGFAHVFQLLARNATDGDTWGLAATLPYSSYGTPVGHGVSCSLSPDGTVAAVLSGAIKVDSVQVPVASNTSSSDSSSSGSSSSSNATSGSSSGGDSSGSRRRRQRRRLLGDGDDVAAGGSSSSSSQQQQQYTTVNITTRQAYLSMYAQDPQPAGSSSSKLLGWASVGSHPLDQVVADCIAGTTVPCRPLVDVNERFAAVSYVKGADLLAEVVYHTAATAAASGKLTDFTKVCTLEKKLIVAAAKTPTVFVPEPSADQLAMVALRQPAKSTGSLRVYAATRDPAAITVWTLSRRGDLACPPSRNLLEDTLNYATLPGMYMDVTADGQELAVSGVPSGNLTWWLGAGW